jgi:hypothetical protein
MHEASECNGDSDDDNDDAEDDGDHDLLVESTVDNHCIDFGSHLYQEFCKEAGSNQAITPFYNPYEIFMPRVKELLTPVARSKDCRERGKTVEHALDNLIAHEKSHLASQKAPPRGFLVYSCPCGKVKKTKVSECGG